MKKTKKYHRAYKKVGQSLRKHLTRNVYLPTALVTVAVVSLTSFSIMRMAIAQIDNQINILQPQQMQGESSLMIQRQPIQPMADVQPIQQPTQYPVPTEGQGFQQSTKSGFNSCAPGTICDGQSGPTQEPGNQPNQGQMGPSEEQMQQMNQQRLEMMKQGLTKFSREMKRVKSQVAVYEKRGVPIPDELKTALGDVDGVIKEIESATDPDSLEDIMMEVQDITDVIQEWMPKLPMLAQLPRIFKQADREIAKADRTYTADMKKAKSVKMDLGSILSDFKNAIDQQKSLLSELKDLSKTDPETTMERLQDEFFGTLDNMWENEQVIQISLNLKRGMSQMDRDIRDADKTVKNLERKKIDTAGLKDLITAAKTKFADVKEMMKATPIDTEAVISAVDSLMETRQEFADKVQEFTGNNGYAMPQLQPTQNNGFQLNLPQGFSSGGSSGGGQ